MKLTMREWAELDAIAWFMQSPVCQKQGIIQKRGRHASTTALAQRGLVRWKSAGRMFITRHGRAALATKTRRFLDYARKIAERDYPADEA